MNIVINYVTFYYIMSKREGKDKMIRIEQVETPRQRREFADYPNKLYKNVPQYLPFLFADSVNATDPAKNFAFGFCDARFWLARRGAEIVGRIGAIINHKADEKWNKRQMRFWQADFIDDREVSAALFEQVESWARESGCTEIVGPLGFTDLDLEGMLTDGFDETGVFCTYYNHPYYPEHLKAMGYEKDIDWVEYRMDIPGQKEELATLARMAEFSQRVYKLHLRECRSVRDIGDAAPEVVHLINLAYGELYSTTELDIDQGASYFQSFKPVLDPKTSALVCNESEELVGFVLAIPDISPALKKSRGWLFPFGWARVLRAIRSNDEYIALLIGVHPEYREKGVITVLLNRLMEGLLSAGVKTCRICPMLEDNSKVLALMNIIPSEPYKRRTSFVKKV